jgi:hypothetical protein
MSKQSRKLVVAGLFLAPVICCVIAIGAFLHVAVSFVEAEEQEKAEMQQQVQKLTATAADLEQELADLEARIAQLQQQLREQQEKAEAARKLAEEIRRLEEQQEALAQQLATLRDKLQKAEELVQQTEQEVQNQREAITATQEECQQARNDITQAEQGVERGNGKVRELLSVDELPAESPEGLQQQRRKVDDDLQRERTETERLQAQLARLRRHNDEMSRSFRLSDLKTTNHWQAPDPVYVECDQQGVLIQTAGTRFGTWPDATDTVNFISTARRTGYVLFLVRPSGYSSFWRYRKTIEAESRESGRAIDYGYEPINEDWILIYPEGS